MGIELASLMPGAVAVITLAAFFTSMVTAMVGAGGGTALLLVMLYVMPASQVVPVWPRAARLCLIGTDPKRHDDAG